MAPLDRLLTATRLGGVDRLSKVTAQLQQILRDSAGRAIPVQVRNHVARERANPSPSRASETTDPGEFLAATFSNQAGSRPYKLYVPNKLYVPSGYVGRPVPLIVMLHGCTQSPDDFAAGTRMNAVAEEHTCLVAYPAQIAAANTSRCWNWYNTSDQSRDQGEPSLIAGITRDVVEHYAVDPRRIYVAGLSAGGAAAAIMGARYPDLYAAIGVHSGLACGAATDLPSAFTAMRQGHAGQGRRPMPAIVFHGDRDSTVSPANARAVIAQSAPEATLDVRIEEGRVPGGHAYTRTIYGGSDGPALEQWAIHGAGHAWMGGSPAGSFTDPHGPDASREMLRFFLEHPKRKA
ncbi:MAG: PHB depolymerase family esterase [Acetobacteraceae bacterium]